MTWESLGESARPSPQRPDLSQPHAAARSGVSLEPMVFGGCLGWLHLPKRGSVRAAIVLCPPLGREARSAHRPLWLLANRLADRGFAVLRYDHPGSGDSRDLTDSDGLTEWTAAVVRAAGAVRERLGEARVVLAGLRIGASLAALAAETVRPDALMLLAPIVRGDRWLRELDLAARMSGADPGQDEAFESDGLVLSTRTAAALTRLDLTTLCAAAPEVLVASPRPVPALEARLETLGAEITSAPFDGYERLMLDARCNTPPEGLFSRAEAWLEAAAAGWPAAEATPGSEAAAVLPVRFGRELPVCFAHGLRGVLCLPHEPKGRRAVVFANTDADPRAGLGGFAAQACRALAAEGIASLRFDFAGLGDSAFDEGWRSHVYETPRGQDFAAALDLLASQGWDQVYLAGVRSGAYHAIHAGLDDGRVAGVFAINPGDWMWPIGLPMAMPTREQLVSSRVLVRDLAKAVLGPLGRRGQESGERARLGSTLAALNARLSRRRRVGPHSAETRGLRRAVRRMLRRGQRLHVAVAYADASLDELETRFGYHGRWLARRRGAAVRILPRLDHGLASRACREAVLEELKAFLKTSTRRSEPRAGREDRPGRARSRL